MQGGDQAACDEGVEVICEIDTRNRRIYWADGSQSRPARIAFPSSRSSASRVERGKRVISEAWAARCRVRASGLIMSEDARTIANIEQDILNTTNFEPSPDGESSMARVCAKWLVADGQTSLKV